MTKKRNLIGIIGMGYVGLPLAIEFGKFYEIVAFDINKKRISELQKGFDRTLELEFNQIKSSKKINFTSNKLDLNKCNYYIITIPTPINKNNKPDLSFIKKATITVSKNLKIGDIVIYESTVYPGTTEEVCVPILEKHSGLKYNKQFYCGYSPERINPGDKKRTLTKITKIVSGSTSATTNNINNLYKKIIKAGTFKTSNIMVAEAAKVIENTQRDINIALMNEISIICSKLKISTNEVLKAAETKWNFMPFKPGLVGGHCVSVDPYYLTYKSEKLGYKPKIILAGRKLNNKMKYFVISTFLNNLKKKHIKVKNAKILLMGLTFKENCPDLRNSQSINIYNKLLEKNMKVDVYDPWVDDSECKKIIKTYTIKKIRKNYYDAIIISVKHDIFKKIKINKILNYCKKNNVIFDLKNILNNNNITITL
tara:strand:+ start:816 stop:2090 length:1275 start_codon:yes stop_codon:yes gene_type:complete